MIDSRMDERRKARREAREREELARYRQERPKISQQFADLKRQLATIDEAEWAAIPEVGDLVGKNRKRSKVPERFTPLPDTLIAAAREKTQYETTIQDSGTASTVDPSGMMTNFREIGQARDKVLGLKLDQVKDSVSGQTTVDPKGYLTDLNSIVVKSDAEIGDIKKARLLLNSVITTNPKHAPGWIAAARLEEVAGRPVQARNLIAKGCEQCPKNEDVWLEAARLNVSISRFITFFVYVCIFSHSRLLCFSPSRLWTMPKSFSLMLSDTCRSRSRFGLKLLIWKLTQRHKNEYCGVHWSLFLIL